VSAFWFYPVWAFKLEKELQKTKSNYNAGRAAYFWAARRPSQNYLDVLACRDLPESARTCRDFSQSPAGAFIL